MTPLETGTGPIAGAAYLPATPEHVLWGRLPCANDEPVLRVDPGTTLTFDALSHEGILEDQGSDPERFFAAHGVEHVLSEAIAVTARLRRDPATDGPHVVSRPVAVTGARPGDLLAITIEETLPRVPYGVISNRHGRGALPGEFPLDGAPSYSVFCGIDDDHTHGLLPLEPDGPPVVRFPLAPFLGILGVAPATDVRPHSVPPGAYGGNLDVRLVTTGATLYLPLQVPDALVYAGDPHFAQGDGEVALTALEASLRATVRLDVVPAAEAVAMFGELAGPLAETSEWLVPTGLDADLDVAMQNCVRAAVALLGARYGMDPRFALAYLSAATDFDVSQVVDLVKGVHARIRKADFAEVRR